MFLKEREKLYI